ncbi:MULTISPECIES: cation:proton antiporter [Planktothrix]|uniref:Na+/H+ antiporter n=2 Tax=Planktothrix TaxID=54304 RepID=A0A6J7ZJG6_PLARU
MSLEATNPEIITQNLERFLMVFSVSLAVAALSRSWAIFRKIPYTLLLVIVGIGLAFVDVRLVNLSPQLILEIFLPPLLFEATWNLSWKNLKSNWLLITLFAIFGVLISIIGIVGLKQKSSPNQA